ncbi:MAG: hypothetical protein GY749_13560 [Desulfobacteraceae bacterium]|nr:hypothetical protein [Desulfobacteraceae bacterium]
MNSPLSPAHTGYIRECDSCSEIASTLLTVDDEKIPMCNVCVRKREFEKELKNGDIKTGAWHKFSEYLRQTPIKPEIHRPLTFGEIGEQCSARKDYTAVVYADGNAMGNLIKDIPDKEHFHFFSNVVDKSIKHACHEALYEIFFKHAKKKLTILPATASKIL